MLLDLVQFAIAFWLCVATVLYLTNREDYSFGHLLLCLAWPYVLVVGLYQLSKHQEK